MNREEVPHISSEVLSGFEEALNQYTFRGVRVGSLISSHLIIDLLNGHYKAGKELREKLMSYYLKYFPRKSITGFDFKSNTAGVGLPMLTFISGKRHLFGMSHPLYQALGDTNAYCLVRDETVLASFGNKPTHYSTFTEIPVYSFSGWRKEFSSMWNKVRPVITGFIGANGIHSSYLIRTKNNLLAETRYIMSFEKLLNFLCPPYIVTEYDRYTYTSALVQTAVKLGIPTYTMMHGVVNNSIGYTPILADRLLAWGERQKDCLLAFGADAKRISITGATQLSNSSTVAREMVLDKLRLPREARVVALATNPLKENLRLALFNVFCGAIEHLKDAGVVGVLKIHPSEDISFYKSRPNLPSNLMIDEDGIIGYEESLAMADLVCNFNSAYAIDALARHKPVVTVNIAPDLLGQSKDIIEFGQLPVAANAEDLRHVIHAWFFDKTFALEVMRKVESYASAYCFAFGSEAAANMLHEIDRTKVHPSVN